MGDSFLKYMKKLLFLTTISVVFIFIPRIVFGSVVINEVFYNPVGTDTNKEYIIIYNNGDESYPLNNYCLYAGGKHFVIPSFSLTSKQSVIIHWNTDGVNTSTDLYTGKTLENMGNTSDVVALFSTHDKHDASTIIDYLRYHTTTKTEVKTWESAAVSAGIWTAGNFIPNVLEGKTIKLKTDGLDTNSPNDWMEAEPSMIQEETEESTTEEPSVPLTGSNHPPIAEAGDNIIAFINQEIKFDGTKSTDPDNNELHYEWNMGDGKLIEKPSFTYIYNYPGTYTVSLMVYDGQYYVIDTAIIKIQTGQITINEFLPNPSGKDEEEEWTMSTKHLVSS